MEWSYYRLATACGPAPLKEAQQGTGQMQMSPSFVPPTGLQPTRGRIWFHIFADNRGRKIPTLYVSSFSFGVCLFEPQPKELKGHEA